MIWILVMKLLNAIARWHERQTTVRRLSRLDDRLLRDIGIHRHEIASVVHQYTRSMPVCYDRHGKTVVLPNGTLMALWCRVGPGVSHVPQSSKLGIGLAMKLSPILRSLTRSKKTVSVSWANGRSRSNSANRL